MRKLLSFWTAPVCARFMRNFVQNLREDYRRTPIFIYLAVWNSSQNRLDIRPCARRRTFRHIYSIRSEWHHTTNTTVHIIIYNTLKTHIHTREHDFTIMTVWYFILFVFAWNSKKLHKMFVVTAVGLQSGSYRTSHFEILWKYMLLQTGNTFQWWSIRIGLAQMINAHFLCIEYIFFRVQRIQVTMFSKSEPITKSVNNDIRK